MKTISYGRNEIDGPSLRRVSCVAVVFGAILLAPSHSRAAQEETTAACDETGIPPIAEPVMMVYGDSTENCVVSPGTDSDLFKFDGLIGEKIRINVLGRTNGFDPAVEIRDDMNNVIFSDNCIPGNSFSTCSFRGDVMLTKNGTYVLSIADVNGNEAGHYTLSLERIFPAPNIERLPYDSLIVVDGRVTDFVDESSVADTISPQTDLDHYFFNGVAGTSIRFNGLGLTNGFDPEIEIRDPTGALVLDRPTDGAGCVPGNSFSTCSFQVDYSPLMTGTYTMIVGDVSNNESGSYQLSLWCIFGGCDNDGDGAEDIRPENLRYGESVTANIVTPQTDGDFYRFMGTPGDTIEFNVLGQSNGFDPQIEVRSPVGAVVLDGRNDPSARCVPGNSFSTCSFSVELAPAATGQYSIVLYDRGTNEAGHYDMELRCVFSPGDFRCANLPGSFPIDVPEDFWAFTFIEKLVDAGITSGCGEDMYCPGDPVTRGQMSVFMLRGINDGNYQPPACEGSVFGDVPQDSIFKCWIEQFFAEGITSGCSQDPAMYCPEDSVNRAQMAVFLLRAKHGSDYMPPPATGNDFDDVSIDYWAAAWIEQLAAEGITSGCSEEPSLYCPEEAVTRDQMAVFVVRTFDLGD